MGLDRLAVGRNDVLRGPDRFQRDPRLVDPTTVELGILDGNEQALAKRGEGFLLVSSLLVTYSADSWGGRGERF